MMKSSRIREGTVVLACCLLAGASFAQQSTLGTTEITAQTSATVESPLILSLGQIQVKDVAGQPLGTLEDIVVSPQGCIDMAVLSMGGTRLVPVPWQVVRTEHSTVAVGATPTVTLQVDRTRLAQAPSIDRGQLRTQLSQATFTQQINTFFGVQGNARLNASDRAAMPGSTNLYGGRIGDTNMFGTRTNMFPTGRTNLFRGTTNTFPPGRNLGRPEGLPPGQLPGPTPGRPDPGFNPGTSPTPPGTPGTSPGTSPTFPNTPRSPGSPNSPGSGAGSTP